MFKGKVVLVYLINPPEVFSGGIAITDPQIVEAENRKFVMGTVPESPDDWTSGLRVSVAFDQIAHFIEFTDEDEFLTKSVGIMPETRGSGIQ